ncbi:MAG: hypothetical protein AAFV59_16850 [Pseudomonadota bacterium]
MSRGQTSRSSKRLSWLKLSLMGSSISLAAPFTSLADTGAIETSVNGKSDITSDERVLEEIIVDGSYLKGSSLSEYEPELVLTESDIAAYGVSSIGELLSIIQVETSSGKQRRSEPPVVLINGRRVSGFRELDNYPVESLARVEVLPEEASLAYGFTANQRVINFVLKSDLQIIPINTRTQAPAGGGTLSNTVDGSRVFIDGNNRSTIRAKVSESSQLTERERDIIPFASDQPRDARSLLPSSELFEMSGLKTMALPDGAIGTFSARFERSESDFLTALSSIDGTQLSQFNRSETLDLGVTINSKLAANTWSVLGNYSQTDRDVENRGTFGFDISPVKTSTRLATLDANANFSLFEADNGPVTFSGALGVASEAFESSSDQISISRETAYIQGAISYPLPIDEDRWGRGTLSVDGRQSNLSDLGSLSDFGVTANWIPVEGVTLTYSWASEDIAPTLQEFALPATLSPNRSFFDLTRSETVTATLVDGGNSDLQVASRDISKIGLVWKPWEKRDLTFSTNYIAAEGANEIRSFSVPAPGLDALGLNQVVRDPAGEIVLLDRTPVNIFESETETLRTSLSWSIPIKPTRAKAPPKPGAKRRKSGRPGSRRLSLIHRWELANELRPIASAGTLDLLDGDTIDSILARPRHLVDLTYYQWNNGWGFYGSAQYRSSSALTTATDELEFSDTLRVILSASYEFNYADKVLDRFPILEETRLTVGIANALDDIVSVTDSRGRTPLAYQKDVLDPVGLGWRVELRKRF